MKTLSTTMIDQGRSYCDHIYDIFAAETIGREYPCLGGS